MLFWIRIKNGFSLRFAIVSDLSNPAEMTVSFVIDYFNSIRNLYDYMIVFLTASFATIRNFFLSEFFSCERRIEGNESLKKILELSSEK